MNLFHWLIGYAAISGIARQQARHEIQQEKLRQELAEKLAKSPERHHLTQTKSQPKEGLTFGKLWQYLSLIFWGFILYVIWQMILG